MILYLFLNDQCSQVIAARGIHYLALSRHNTNHAVEVPEVWNKDELYEPNKIVSRISSSQGTWEGGAKDISCGVKKHSCLTVHRVGLNQGRHRVLPQFECRFFIGNDVNLDNIPTETSMPDRADLCGHKVAVSECPSKMLESNEDLTVNLQGSLHQVRLFKPSH